MLAGKVATVLKSLSFYLSDYENLKTVTFSDIFLIDSYNRNSVLQNALKVNNNVGFVRLIMIRLDSIKCVAFLMNYI